MFAVTVTFTLKPGRMDRFLPLMTENARTSLTAEAGCRRFDVLTDPDRPDSVFLYELYDSSGAFDLHLQSAHFKAFDAAVAEDIAGKTVATFRTVAT